MRARWECCLVGALVLTLPRAALADGAAACIGAHTTGQELRLHGKWRDARLRFASCAASSCPAPVAADCTRWATELAARLPTVILSAQAPDGSDTIDVRLTLDGAPFADRLPTTAIELDPGEHVLRFEHPGWTAASPKLVVREGEKDRRVVVRFGLPAPALAIAPEAPAPRSASRALGVTMLVVAGIAAGVGTPFGIVGKVREDDLASEPCGKSGTCDPGAVAGVRRDYWTAGIAAGVGVVALAVGIWQLAVHPSSPSGVGADARGIRVTF